MPYYSGSDVVKRVPVKVTARQLCVLLVYAHVCLFT